MWDFDSHQPAFVSSPVYKVGQGEVAEFHSVEVGGSWCLWFSLSQFFRLASKLGCPIKLIKLVNLFPFYSSCRINKAGSCLVRVLILVIRYQNPLRFPVDLIHFSSICACVENYSESHT